MIAKQSRADINVVALIGERGKEVNDFIERDLGGKGLAKSVLVVATSEQPPLLRIRGAFIATAVAEYFRDKGHNVLLMMDSLTRLAMAQREVGLAAGEPPTTKGYTPSVFSLLPYLLERAGTSAGKGSITGLYSVLVEGDDMNDPIADAVRGILDGHIVLSRELADRNHYPAIDILSSISRTMIDIVSPEHRQYAAKLKEVLATYHKMEDLIHIGAYAPGSNADTDYAISVYDKICDFLKQDINEAADIHRSVRFLKKLFTGS
jgi:flagellum-specific ATP synthase